MAKTKRTPEEIAEEELRNKFPSVMRFSVRVMRPAMAYPYEREVWGSELVLPIAKNESQKEIEAAVSAWHEMLHAALKISKIQVKANA